MSEAYYDSTDTSHVLAYKKSIAGMFSVDMQAGERTFDGDSLMIHVKSPISLKGGPVKTEEKVHGVGLAEDTDLCMGKN